MDKSTYQRSVFLTFSQKPAQVGVRLLSRDRLHLNVVHCAVGLATESAELVGALAPYLSGEQQYHPDMLPHAREEAGDIGYYLVALAKLLKVKLPNADKKIKPTQTRVQLVLSCVALAGDIADLAKKVFYGPPTKTVNKLVSVPVKDAATGAVKEISKVEKDVVIPDDEALKALRAEQRAKMAELLTKLIPVYWAMSWSLFDQPPSHLFAANRAKLAARYPEGYFTHVDAHTRNTDKEIEASEAAAEASAEEQAKAA